MSEELEALKILSEVRIKSDNLDYILDVKEKFKIIEKALKRNEPQKVLNAKWDVQGVFGDCPNCQSHIYYDNIADFNFCIHCGQKLDWSDNNE